MCTSPLPLKLNYSRFCPDALDMVITATENGKFVRKTFNPHSGEFVAHECSVPSCQQVDRYRKTFEFGNQGVHFRRFHRDRHANPLICLTVSWKYDEIGGSMDVFCNKDGEIGRYTWNEREKCFDGLQKFNVAVLPFTQSSRLIAKNSSLMRKNATIDWDEDLVFCGAARCEEIEADVFFLFNQKTFRTKQYIFNQTRLQFEKVDLSDVTMDPIDSEDKMTFEMDAVFLKTRSDSKIQKCRARNIIEGAAPIRDICHMSLADIMKRKLEQERIVAREGVPILHETGRELWILVTGESSEDTLVVDMSGEILMLEDVISDSVPSSPETTMEMNASVEKEEKEEDVAEETTVTTSDLSPLEWECRRSLVFSALNSLRWEIQVFKYDSTDDCFRQIQWCPYSAAKKTCISDFGPGSFVKRGKTVTLLKTGTNGRLEVKDYNDFFKGVVREPMRVEMLGDGAVEKRRRLLKKKNNNVSFFCDGFLDSNGCVRRVNTCFLSQ